MAKRRSSRADAEAVRKSFHEKKFSPLYLLFGDEDFLLDQTLADLLESALEPETRSFNLDIVSGQAVDARALVALASAFPMNAERRVVLVTEFDRLSEKDLLISYLEHPLASTVLVLVTDRPDFRQKVYKILERDSVVLEFRQLYESDIPAWIDQRIQSRGKKSTPEACQLLQAHVGNSLREIQNEIDKLFIYVGERGTIGVDDVSRVVGVSRQFNIFELQKAVGQKDMKRALEIAGRMLETGEAPVYMVTMLTRYFEKIWCTQELRERSAGDSEIASAIGVSPYFVKEFVAASKEFSARAIERSFSALLETDEALKSSKGQPGILMTLLIYRLISGRAGTKDAGLPPEGMLAGMGEQA